MVQEPSFFTLALQEVRRLRSRSVAVSDRRSPAASNKYLERIGIVVLRSTTPCVAVNSRSNSNLLTVISIVVVPAATAASTGINHVSLNRRLPHATFSTTLRSNIKLIKPVVTVGGSQKWKTFLTCLFSYRFHLQPNVETRSQTLRTPYYNLPQLPISLTSCTTST